MPRSLAIAVCNRLSSTRYRAFGRDRRTRSCDRDHALDCAFVGPASARETVRWLTSRPCSSVPAPLWSPSHQPLWILPSLDAVPISSKDRLHLWSKVYDNGKATALSIFPICTVLFATSAWKAQAPALYLPANFIARNRKVRRGRISRARNLVSPLTQNSANRSSSRCARPSRRR